jgi:Proteasome non-ATPase 26S subunit
VLRHSNGSFIAGVVCGIDGANRENDQWIAGAIFFLAPFVVAGSDRGAIIKVAVGLVATPTTVPQKNQSGHVGYGIKLIVEATGHATFSNEELGRTQSILRSSITIVLLGTTMLPDPVLREKPEGSNEETRESAQDLEAAKTILHEIHQQLEAPSATDQLARLLQDLGDTAGVADTAEILARQVLLDDGSSALGHFPALKTTAYLASTLFPFRAACLAAVHNLVQGGGPSSWTASTELIRLVVSLLHDEQVAVANAASDLLVELCQEAAGVRFWSLQNESRNASSPLDDRGMFLQTVMTTLVESGCEVWDCFIHGQFSPPLTKNHTSVVCIRFAATILKLVAPVSVAGIMEYASVPVKQGDSTLSPLGLVEQMLNSSAEIVQNDFLFRMSLFDLLETLANECSRRGPLHASDDRLRKWLYSHPICGPVVKLAGGGDVVAQINDSKDDLPDAFLGGPALRLVAALCRVEPIVEPVQLGTEDEKMEEDQSQMRLLQGFHRALHNFDVTGELDRLAMVDALSSFASYGHLALGLILNDAVTRQAWLSLSVAQPKLKSVIIHSVALVLDPRDAADGAYETAASPTTAAKTSLFRALGETNQVDTPQLLLGLAKSPLPEVRLAAMRTMGATVRGTPSGAQELLSHPDCLTWLLNRDGESTAEGRLAKFDVVRTVARHPILRGLLDNRVLQQMEQYIQQGPHYVKAQQWDVAVQD